MKAILYLWKRTIANHIRQVFKKPVTLILYLLMLALLIFTFSVSHAPEEAAAEGVFQGYSAILFGVFLFIGGINVWGGLKQGTALFSMADVNFLFTAPVGARRILIMGIMRQAGIMLLASVFMLFQYPNMRNNGLDVMALVGLIVSYFLMGFSTQLLAAVVYAFCAGRSKRRKRMYDGLMAFFALLLLGGALYALRTPDLLTGIQGYLSAEAWGYLPIFGWARNLALAFAGHAWMQAALYAALMLAGVGLCTLLLQRTDMDYFEDVLLAAERANQKVEDAKAGRVADQGEVSKRVKRDQGSLTGMGALAFTGRMLREQSRKGALLLDSTTLTALIGPVMGLIFMNAEVRAEIGYWGVIGMTLWMQLFFTLQTGMARELSFPYIYLAPRPAFQKLIAVMLPGVLKSAVDGLVFGAALVALYNGTLLDGIAGWFIYISIMLLFAAGMLVVERLLGATRNRMLTMLVYIGILLLLCVPGIVLATLLAPTNLVGYLLFGVWNIGIALLLVFLCRNILHSMDMA